MDTEDKRNTPVANREGSGAAGGKKALRPEQQAPQGVEPDSEVDEKLRRSQQHKPSGLEPNTIVRN